MDFKRNKTETVLRFVRQHPRCLIAVNNHADLLIKELHIYRVCQYDRSFIKMTGSIGKRRRESEDSV